MSSSRHPVRRRLTAGTLLSLLLGLAWVGVASPERATAAGPVTYGGSTTAVQAAATRSVTITKPAATTAGDVLVASFTADNAPGISAVPAGWTSVLAARLRAGSSSEAFAYYRVVTAADAQVTSWTWTLGTAQKWSGGIARYVGVDTTSPLDTTVAVASSNAARTSITIPSLTTSTGGAMLVGSVGADSATVAITQPVGWSEAWDTGAGKVSEHAYRSQPAAGATGGQTWTLSSARGLVGWMAALRPASAPPPPPAPTASFSLTPTQGSAPLKVAFTDTSTGSPTSWSWTFGDGETSTEQNPSHTYLGTGTFTVSLTATNASGSDTVTRTDVVTVQVPSAPPPTASFTVSPDQGVAPLAVSFTDTSTGSPTSWSWTFGDGSTSTAQNPSHTYAGAGTYTVSLRATNASGSDTITRTGVVTVQPAPGQAPTASFTLTPTQGTAPLTVGFTDTSTGSPTSWSWTFGDGGTSTEQNPSHTYAAAGTYTVSLRATNASGSDTVTRTDVVTVQAAPPAGSNVLVGAGDIAGCSQTRDSATGALVSATPGTVFTLGDNVYDNGTASEFANCYDPAWGAFKNRTRPVAGNHDYNTTNAAPYYAYFGAAAGDPTKGYYSYDIGSDWHVVVLNSNCSFIGGCGAGSPQEQWLRADLAASTRPCTVAMWHHPRFSSGIYGFDPSTTAFSQALYDDGVELVLNGHEHDYERFALQNPAGALDTTYGIRQITVGTGGADLRTFDSTAPNSVVRSVTSYGVLKLTLDSGSYTWNFLPIAGSTLNDSGTGSCHGAPSTTTVPTASFIATPTSGTAPLPVEFSDTSTGSPTSWLWTFGDGTTSTTQSPSHTYAAPGTYTVSLRATNANGSDTVTRTGFITVGEQPPPPPPGSGYQDVVLLDRPAGYWRLGESAGTTTADAAGGPAATVVGGVTRGLAGVSGDGNTAVRLDGTTGYVRVDNRDSLNFTTQNFTVEAWARPTAVGTTGGAVVQKGDTTGYPGWQYRISLTSGGKWRATVFVGSTNVTATDTGTPSTTRWTHLVLVRSGAQVTLYVNGVAAATTSFTGSVNTSTGMLAIGRSGAASDGYFNGAVDEVAVYPTALTASQVLNHYNAATSK
jgi:PKD repeat protein